MATLSNRTVRGYRLREKIGSGGQGIVYKAYQPTVERDVAIKIIQPQYANQPTFIRRFEVEAQLIARLEHPHIVPLYDYWRDPEGAYLVMRWLPNNLNTALNRGPWKLEAAARLLDQLAAALSVAHRDGVVHRDIKPANILLDEDENVYLADFGIAQDVYLRVPEDAVDVSGSPAYLTPEVLRRQEITARSDLYSLGYVMYEVLTGAKPFADVTTASDYIQKHLNEPMPMMSIQHSGIPAALDEVLQTATAKDPMQRYATVQRFAAAFRAAIPPTLPRIPAQPLADPLTERELDVLKHMVEGRDNAQIAEKLFLTVGTVRWYVKQIYSKLDAHSRHQAIDKARLLHLLERPLLQYVSIDVRNLPEVPTPRIAVDSVPELENPYKGLRAFQESDASDFFGRAALTEQLLSRLAEKSESVRLLIVVGPSGSGKSSLVRAGLMPALRRGALRNVPHPFVTDMLPGTHPFEELEAALLRVAVTAQSDLMERLREDRRGLVRAAKRILPNDAGTELILVIDQFEELFTLVEAEAEQIHFIDNLLSAVTDPRGRVRVILTLRADFYDRPLLIPRLAELMRASTEIVIPLNARELEQAIIAPVERVGVRLESGLATTIINEVAEQPGALPLVQYALTELFEQREGNTLTLRAYRAIGGVTGALARRADEVYASLDADAQTAAQQMFLRLITLGEGTEDTRRRVLHVELSEGTDTAQMEDVIEAFADYRLITLDRDPLTRTPTIEIAHEALIREWGRLRDWLRDNREDIRTQRRLAAAAVEWQVGKDTGFLASGARLNQFETFAEQTTLTLTAHERAYLAASLAERMKLERQEAERQDHETQLEQRSRRFLRLLVGVFAVAAVLALGLSILALSLNGQAMRSAAQFRSIALASGARQALLNRQPDVALALALASLNIDEPPKQSELAFFEAATSSWIVQRYVGGHTSTMRDVVFFRDGRRMVTSGFDGRAVVWDIATGEQLQAVQTEDRIHHLAVHPDGTIVAAAGIAGEMYLWNLATDEVIGLDVGEISAQAPIFNHDGTLLIGATQDGHIYVWNVATLERIRTFATIGAQIFSVSFNPDETLLIAASRDGAARIWDFETGELVQMLNHPAAERSAEIPWVWEALFLPDGEHVISCDTNAVIRMWNWRSGAVIWTTKAPDDPRDLALSPDGKLFFTGADATITDVHLWETETGSLIRAYEGHTDIVNNVDFSPDGTTLLSSSYDGTAILWNVQWEGTRATFPVPGANQIAVHPSEPIIAVSIIQPDTPAHAILLINTETNAVLHQLDGNREFIQSLAFSPDGRLLLSGDAALLTADIRDQDVYVWDVETGDRLAVLEDHFGWIQSIAFSPDARTVAIGEATGSRIIFWDLATFTRTRELEGHSDWVTGISFSPDGRSLYSAARDGAVLQWDVESGTVVRTFAGHDTAVYGFDMSEDGGRLFTAAIDGTARVWDTITGELMFNLEGHSSGIYWLDYTAVGNAIVTTAGDGTLILWDAATGERLRRYVNSQTEQGGLIPVPAVFSPDGQLLISGYDGQIILWDATPLPESLNSWVTNHRYVPELTCEQRELYQLEPYCMPDSPVPIS